MIGVTNLGTYAGIRRVARDKGRGFPGNDGVVALEAKFRMIEEFILMMDGRYL